MATMTSINLSIPRLAPQATDHSQRAQPILNRPWKSQATTRLVSGRMLRLRPLRAAPDQISDQVEKSIKDAEETCSDNPTSGECVAAWDEVEELSAAASHARDKKKAEGSDPLENYCKDNPETDECRTYDN